MLDTPEHTPLSPAPRLTITAALTGSLKASQVSTTVTIGRHEYESLLDRMNLLQEVADRCAEYDLQHIASCSSFQQAIELQDSFNSLWFRDAPYSDDKLREIAEALMEACGSYLPSNPVWLRATQGIYPQADLFADTQKVMVPNAKPSSKLEIGAPRIPKKS